MSIIGSKFWCLLRWPCQLHVFQCPSTEKLPKYLLSRQKCFHNRGWQVIFAYLSVEYVDYDC